MWEFKEIDKPCSSTMVFLSQCVCKWKKKKVTYSYQLMKSGEYRGVQLSLKSIDNIYTSTLQYPSLLSGLHTADLITRGSR
jgi:hypothetical protein